MDEYADLDTAWKVCFDAKVQYPAVCNAIETLLINRKIADSFLPKMAEMYLGAGVELRCDEDSYTLLEKKEGFLLSHELRKRTGVLSTMISFFR